MENAVWFARTGARDLSAAAPRAACARAWPAEPPRVEKDARGKPFLQDFPGIQISISHTRGAVAVALSERPAGVDVEPASRTLHDWFPARFFTGAERSLADCPEEVIAVWTRKEALLKRDGRGITLPLRGGRNGRPGRPRDPACRGLCGLLLRRARRLFPHRNHALTGNGPPLADRFCNPARFRLKKVEKYCIIKSNNPPLMCPRKNLSAPGTIGGSSE